MQRQQNQQKLQNCFTFFSEILTTPKSKVTETPENIRNQVKTFCDLLIWCNKKKPLVLKEYLSGDFNLQNVLRIRPSDYTLNNSKSKNVQIQSPQNSKQINQPQWVSVVRRMILLLANTKSESPLSQYLIHSGCAQRVLMIIVAQFDPEQHLNKQSIVQYIANYCRAYHSHLTSKNLHCYSKNDRFILVQLCCIFFQYHQQITRTSVMNILLAIMKMEEAKQFISRISIHSKVFDHWAVLLSIQLRNKFRQLINLCIKFDKFGSEKQIQYNSKAFQSSSQNPIVQFQKLQDEISFWEDLTALQSIKNLFVKPFLEEVLMPFMQSIYNKNLWANFKNKEQHIRSFRQKSFALVFTKKLIQVVKNLNLMKQFTEMLFGKFQPIKYAFPEQTIVNLGGLQISKLLMSQPLDDLIKQVMKAKIQRQPKQNNFCENIIQLLGSCTDAPFYQETFIKGNMILLPKLILVLLIQFFSDLSIKISESTNFAEMLLAIIQMPAIPIHIETLSLKAIRSILLYHQKQKICSQSIILGYRGVLKQLIKRVQFSIQNEDNWWSEIQCFEYDMKIVSLIVFPEVQNDKSIGSKIIKIISRIIKDYREKQKEKQSLFYRPRASSFQNPFGKAQNSNPIQNLKKQDPAYYQCFYNIVPKTPKDLLRYSIMKFLLWNKFYLEILSQFCSVSFIHKFYGQNWNCVDEYVKAVNNKSHNQQKYSLNQQILKAKLKGSVVLYDCILYDRSQVLPGYVIDDDNSLILAVKYGKQMVKIYINKQLKFITQIKEETKETATQQKNKNKTTQVIKKKQTDQNKINLNINTMDRSLHNIKQKQVIQLKHFEPGIDYINVRRTVAMYRELSFINGLLKIAENQLKEVSKFEENQKVLQKKNNQFESLI